MIAGIVVVSQTQRVRAAWIGECQYNNWINSKHRCLAFKNNYCSHLTRNRGGQSDTEGESAARRHARRRREMESGSESESGHRQRRQRHSRRSAENLTYHEEKWKNIQTRIRDARYDGLVQQGGGWNLLATKKVKQPPLSFMQKWNSGSTQLEREDSSEGEGGRSPGGN